MIRFHHTVPRARVFAKDFRDFFKISEGLGNFPTSIFQRILWKGYPFPMLAMKVFSYSLLQQKAPFCQTYAKEKRCNLKKDYNAS